MLIINKKSVFSACEKIDRTLAISINGWVGSGEEVSIERKGCTSGKIIYIS